MVDLTQAGLAPSRRNVLGLLAGCAGLCVTVTAGAQVCVDPTKLSPGDRSLRQSLNFKDKSPDPKRSCSGCAFYSAAQAAGCGRCVMLSGGPVDGGSVCDSWTARK